jgi:hypothetical protein
MPLWILVEETQLKVGYWCKTPMCTLLVVLAIIWHIMQHVKEEIRWLFWNFCQFWICCWGFSYRSITGLIIVQSVQTNFCIFCDTPYKQVLKHVSTRWFSLKKTVSRMLEMYLALESYYLSGSEKQPRLKRLTKQFENPMTEVYLLGKAYRILLNVYK